MNRKIAVGLGLAIMAGFVAVGLLVWTMPLTGQEAKKLSLKVLTPVVDVKVILTVDKKAIPGTGNEREIEVTSKKDAVVVTATWEPNNYTKIMRSRKITVKEGAPIEVDLRSGDAKQPDDIEVIFVPTPDDVVEGMVITAVKTFKAKRGVGVDIDPVRVKESKEAAKKAGVDDKVAFRQGDVLKVDDISDADVVLLYMGDDINLRLRPILQKTLKKGSRIVSHRFLMGDWAPKQTLKYKGTNGYDYELHLWVIGQNDKLEKSDK
jgi:hypothetical protein